MRKRIAVFAYLKNNIGDDIFVKLLCERYPHVDFYISKLDSPNLCLERIRNLHFSRRMKQYEADLGSAYLPTQAERFFLKFDALILIGGSIFMQPANNWQEHLQRNINRMKCARKLFVVGANFGPYKTQKFRDEYSKWFSQLEDVCFRDLDSVAQFPENENIRWAPDIVFSCTPVEQEEINQVLISVIDCGWIGRPQEKELIKEIDNYEMNMAKLCCAFHKAGCKVRLAAFCTHQRDHTAAQRIIGICLKNGITDIERVDYCGNVSDMLNEIAKSKYVVATRFHAMILGWTFGKATYPVIYDKKQKNVIREVGFTGGYCNISDVDADKILKSLEAYTKFDCSEYSISAEKQFLALDRFFTLGGGISSDN